MNRVLTRRILLAAVLGWAVPAAAQGTAETRGGDSLRHAIEPSRRTAITTAVARVAPAVVTVQTERVERTVATPFDVFFGARPGSQVQA